MTQARFSFEDFQQMMVIRTRGVAEVVVAQFVSTPGDGFEADDGKPVRLIGFEADQELSDYEVLEEAYAYYLAFSRQINRRSPP